MEYTVSGRHFALDKSIRDNATRRRSFNALAEQTFGLSFEGWYQAGYWTDQYIPYALLDGERVVANVSVNLISTEWQGRPKRFVQLGTVMTDEAYRGRGLSRILMNDVLAEWQDQCDMMYLYANDAVLDFYPAFGFEKAREHQLCLPVCPRPGSARRLDMDNGCDIALLKSLYEASNPFSALPMLSNWGLLMFHCTGPVRDCIYHLPEQQAIVIAGYREGSFVCYDIFGSEGAALADIVSQVAPPGCGTVRFGFAVRGADEGLLAPITEEDSTLFVLSGKENVFAVHKTMLPFLSQA